MKTKLTTSNFSAPSGLIKPTFLAALLPAMLLFGIQTSQAGSAKWRTNPASGDWNTATNWTPATVPNGAADTAMFGVSNTTGVSTSANTEVNRTVFKAGASGFTITTTPTVTFTISGVGITNLSGTTQNFVTTVDGAGNQGTIDFRNSATAGTLTNFTNNGAVSGAFGGIMHFFDSSTAQKGNFTTNGGAADSAGGGFLQFFGTSTAGDGTFTNNGSAFSEGVGAEVDFFDSSTAGNSTFMNNGGSGFDFSGFYIQFAGTSTAGNATFTSNGSTAPNAERSFIFFSNSSTAGNATFISNGSAVSGAGGVEITFYDTASAGNASFTHNGGAGGGPGASYFFGNSTADNSTFTLNGGAVTSGFMVFAETSTVGNATLVANAGLGGDVGGAISMQADSTGGTARVKVFGNGFLDISFHNAPGFTTGSIEGSGAVFLGVNNLTVGSNNLTQTFSGVMQDGGQNGGTGGSLTKIGTGILTLSDTNTYTGGTIVNEGTLLVTNTGGSGMGSGAVQVNAGTLGGTGKIAGAVTVGTGSGPGAVLSPGVISPGKRPGTLTINNLLTFNSDGTYKFELRTSNATADKAVAKGVTINSGGLFSFIALGNDVITPGTVFTVIDNFAATPIAGTFSNLADGAIFTVGGNTFQANYEGGDGNDLTLTVQ